MTVKKNPQKTEHWIPTTWIKFGAVLATRGRFFGGFFYVKSDLSLQETRRSGGCGHDVKTWGEIGQRNRLKVFVFFGGKKNPNGEHYYSSHVFPIFGLQ